MAEKQFKLLQILTPLLAIILAVVSYFGAFVSSTYERETLSMAAQGIGQDLFNLFFVVPLLVISLVAMKKHSKIYVFIYGGTLFYVLYSFIIYSLGVHFNNMFLFYCMTLGLSVYSFIIYLYGLDPAQIKGWFQDKVPSGAVGIFLVIVAVLFYYIWLSETLPAVLNNTVPPSVINYGLLVNPVHVIDLSIALPGLIIAAFLIMQRHAMGYLLAPLGLVFTIVMALALAAMGVMLKIENISEDFSLVYIFGVLAVVSTGFLVSFLAKIKK